MPEAAEPAAPPSHSTGPVRPLPPVALPLHEFERCVSRYPDRTAVRFGAKEVSYRRLDAMAAAVAGTIAARGPTGELVAVCLPRCIELVAVIYGIHKAGFGYLPLDTAGPKDRLGYLLGDAGVSLVITDRPRSSTLPAADPVLVEEIDWLAEPAAAVPRRRDDALAYAIYTSGSTGRPKGVAVSHRSLWNRIDWMQREYPLGPNDRVLQKTPYTFDVSVWELFWPLMYGATLVLLAPDAHRDPDQIIDCVEKHSVTVAHFVPSMLSMFLEFHEPGRCRSLRLTFSSGEALSYPLVDRFSAQLPDTRLINLYGPTEATIDVTAWDCADPREGTAPPIGRPIQNTQCLVLTSHGRLAPVGTVGELHLSGVGLAVGYLNHPELTERSFVANPYGYGTEEFARLYRTGDLARVLESGNIEYLGRNDDQVKVHGFRIELSEVNAALEEDTHVAAAVTIKRDEQLVAFVQARPVPDDAALVEQLRTRLAERLPGYLLPHRLVLVDRIPVTGNGKVDRTRLSRVPLTRSARLKLVEAPEYRRPVTAFQDSVLRYGEGPTGHDRYVLQWTVPVTGTIDRHHFATACATVTARHDMLRARFPLDPASHRYHWVCADHGAEPEFVDLSGSTGGDRRAAELSRLQRDLGFPLATDPPVRFVLVQLAADRAVIIVTTHHVVLDGRSADLLTDELMRVYAALCSGAPVPELPAPVTFAEYADWVDGLDPESARTYWADRLTGTVPGRFLVDASTLGARRPDPADGSRFLLRNRQFVLPEKVSRALREHGLTLSTAMNLVFAMVLSRYLGKLHVTWGNTVDMRPAHLEGGDRIIGPCIATVPITADLAADGTMVEHLERLQLQVVESRQHAHLHPAAIAAAGPSGSLFDALFTFQRGRQGPAADGEADSPPISIEISSHYPLTLSVTHLGTSVELHVSARDDVLDQRQLTDFTELLVGTAGNLAGMLDTPPSQIDVCSPAYRGAARPPSLLSGPDGLYTSGEDLLPKIREFAEQNPDRTAVVDPDERAHTYAELERASDRLAWSLRHAHVGGAVGIALPRSFDLVVAALAVLKTGGQIVSLELDFPDGLLRDICSRLGVSGLITAVPLRDRFSGLASVMVDPRAHDAPDTRFPVRNPGSACVVNYTSGSTGRPKFVRTGLDAHANRLAWLRETFPARADDVFCLRTRLAFAPALREILEPLTQGAPLVLIPESAASDVTRFTTVMREHHVTRMFLTPSLIRVLLDSGAAEAMEELRIIEISGEPVPTDLVERLRSRIPGTTLLNRYGATEAASVVWGELPDQADAPADHRPHPVGTPIRNTSVLIVDEHGRLVPRAVVGEIWLAGDSTSLGYSDLAQTAASFGFHMLSDGNEQHLFKTGDLGYVDDHGQLHFSGRRSRMIKRAGFRIEPRAIELALEEHPDIDRCVLATAVGGPTGMRLVAIVTAVGAEAPSIRDLRRFATERLPPYMLPHEYRTVAAIPLTDSGKVDHVALGRLAQTTSGAPEPAATVVEERLVTLFCDVLRCSTVSVLDDFADLGGDSLLAMRLAHKIGIAFDRRVTPRMLFEHGTIRRLAEHLTARLTTAPYLLLGSPAATATVVAFPPAGGTAASYRSWEPYLGDRTALYAFDPLPGEPTTVEEIAEYYVARIRDLTDQQVVLAGWSLGGTIAYATGCLMAEAGLPVSRLFLVDPAFYTPEYDDTDDPGGFAAFLERQLDVAQIPTTDRESLVGRLVEDSRLVRGYRPTSYQGALTIVKPRKVSAEERNFRRPLNGLEHCAAGHIRVRVTLGNHMTMMSRHASEICQLLASDLHSEGVA
ncbi:amino acid adenylation domain-containing protein [Streptomyces sp. NPDC005408]|uniref:amino acid adenylation domain-containing protein n=1 Tax=Streptomyces sp. NPDC005408 TaxID=3155341 RepID=UPI0033B79A9C